MFKLLFSKQLIWIGNKMQESLKKLYNMQMQMSFKNEIMQDF